MSASASARIHIDRSPDTMLALVHDPRRLLPVITGFGEFTHFRDLDDSGRQEWDLIYHVGTLQLGGRIDVDPGRPDGLDWHSIRGTRHTFAITVADDGGGTRVDLEMRLSLSGLLMARVAERAARGIMRRHLEAAAQQLRHHAEWDD